MFFRAVQVLKDLASQRSGMCVQQPQSVGGRAVVRPDYPVGI